MTLPTRKAVAQLSIVALLLGTAEQERDCHVNVEAIIP
jgi:hypothetical protein